MKSIRILSPNFNVEVGESIGQLSVLTPKVTLFSVTIHIPVVANSKK